MADLLQEAEGIKGGIAGIKNNVKALQAQYKQALFAISPEQTNSILAHENITFSLLAIPNHSNKY